MVFFVAFVSIVTVSAQNPYQNELSVHADDSISTVKNDSLFMASGTLDGEWSHLTINSDKRINKLLEISEEENKRRGGISGYRVQIFQGEKDEAYSYKSEFLKGYPDYKVYVLFKTPDFRVRVGDFRSRSETIKLKYLIEKDFPNSFIVEDFINFPELKTN
ncbi:MAG: SPOR domain-containing protein [Prolixibacteraceae bacterium]|nr:SPOR domain-containing protein [Prolixibacteraceae bacterium]